MLPYMAGLPFRRIAWLIALPVLLIAAAVFAAATIERTTAIDAGHQQQASQRLLTAMLDQETGARGYFDTGDVRFLQPWYQGASDFASALANSRSLAGADPTLLQALNGQAARGADWHAATQAEIVRLEGGGLPPTVREWLATKATMDSFRAANASYDAQVTQRGNDALSRATWFAVALIAGLSIVLISGGLALARRVARRESESRRGQRELRELLQVSESEPESRMLLIRHIERTVPGSGVAVLNRNNSENRLEPALSSNADQTPLRDVDTEQMQPRSCMAVRLSRSFERRPGDEPLLQCEVCGKIAADVICEPLLVGGEVIGSVLVTREKAIDERRLGRVRESVLQAAPILANQRNLALAETRAATDALTGLPNRRAADESLKRMAAHAGRTVTRLAAVLLDLDHFKQINDIHGHDQGDHALAAVGQILTSGVRASDFAARYGGEEFLLLLPDTDRHGAHEVAEKLRVAIERAEIPAVGTVTASFGVAVLPDDAVETEQLIRKTDRALYAAKAGGRNRVETAAPTGGLSE